MTIPKRAKIASISSRETEMPKRRLMASGRKGILRAAGAGAAMLAAKAVGEDLEPLEMIKVYEPSERQEDYNKKYAKFREIEKKLWA